MPARSAKLTKGGASRRQSWQRGSRGSARISPSKNLPAQPTVRTLGGRIWRTASTFARFASRAITAS